MDEYPLLNLFWTSIMIMFMFMWFWVVISTFADNFSRTDHGGWSKALWTVFIIFLPILGVFVYMISRPNVPVATRGMGMGASATAEITQAKSLLDSGAITQAEFDQIKSRTLA